MSNGVNFMREHIIEKARVHYVTEEGGGQPNVVPAYARTWYYVRAPERDQVEYIYKWVLDIADGADKMARTTHEVEFLTGCYNTLPNGALSELVREIGAPVHDDEDVEFAEKLNESIDRDQKINGLRKSERPGWEKLVDELFDERVLDDYRAGKVGAGSTDVSDVSWVTPAIEFTTTCVMLGTPGHSWQNVAHSGLDLLTKPELLKRVRDEWEERLAGRVYKPPIPADLKPPLHQLE
jgi:aminobenzoyl-glutamate utilization protein B